MTIIRKRYRKMQALRFNSDCDFKNRKKFFFIITEKEPTELGLTNLQNVFIFETPSFEFTEKIKQMGPRYCIVILLNQNFENKLQEELIYQSCEGCTIKNPPKNADHVNYIKYALS